MPENKNDAIASTIDGYADKVIGAFENSNMFQNIWKVIKVVGLAGIGIGGFVLGQKLEDSQNLSEMVERVKTFFGKGGPGDPSTTAKAQEPIEIPSKAEIESVKPKGDETAKSDKRKAKAEKASSNTRIALDNATKMNKLTERSKEIMSNYGLKSITSRTESIGTANIDKNFGNKTEDEIASTASNAITIQDIAATINTDHIETLLAANNELLATISQQVGLIHTNQVTTMVAKKSKAELMEILSKKDEESSKILEEQNAKVESYTETLMKNKLTAENKSNQNLAKSSDDNSVGGFGSKMTNFPWGKTLKTASVLAMPLLLKKAMEILTDNNQSNKAEVDAQAKNDEDLTNRALNGEFGPDLKLEAGETLHEHQMNDYDIEYFNAKKEYEEAKNNSSWWDRYVNPFSDVNNPYSDLNLKLKSAAIKAETMGTATKFFGGLDDNMQVITDDKTGQQHFVSKVKHPDNAIKLPGGKLVYPNEITSRKIISNGRIINRSLYGVYDYGGNETGELYDSDTGKIIQPVDKDSSIPVSKRSNPGFKLVPIDNATNSQGKPLYAKVNKDGLYELTDGSFNKPDEYYSNVNKYISDGKGGYMLLNMEGPDDKNKNSTASNRSNTRGTGRSISIATNTNFTGFGSVHGYADALDDSGAFVETSPVGGANISPGTMSPTPDLPTPEDMDETARQEAIAAANKMMSLKDSLVYSQAQRDPEKGSSDCSSTVQYVLKKMAGVDPGFNTVSQITNEEGTWVDRSGIKYDGTGEGKVPDESKLAPGDVIFVRPSEKRQDMSRPYRVGHAEMYVGNGMLMGQTGEAPGHKGPVYHALNTPWIVRGYIGAKRFIKNKDYSNIPTGILNPTILNDEKANIGTERIAEIEASKPKQTDFSNLGNISVSKITAVKTGSQTNPPKTNPAVRADGTPTMLAAPEQQGGNGGNVKVDAGGNDNSVTIDNSQKTEVKNIYTTVGSYGNPDVS